MPNIITAYVLSSDTGGPIIPVEGTVTIDNCLLVWEWRQRRNTDFDIPPERWARSYSQACQKYRDRIADQIQYHRSEIARLRAITPWGRSDYEPCNLPV